MKKYYFIPFLCLSFIYANPPKDQSPSALSIDYISAFSENYENLKNLTDQNKPISSIDIDFFLDNIGDYFKNHSALYNTVKDQIAINSTILNILDIINKLFKESTEKQPNMSCKNLNKLHDVLNDFLNIEIKTEEDEKKVIQKVCDELGISKVKFNKIEDLKNQLYSSDVICSDLHIELANFRVLLEKAEAEKNINDIMNCKQKIENLKQQIKNHTIKIEKFAIKDFLDELVEIGINFPRLYNDFESADDFRDYLRTMENNGLYIQLFEHHIAFLKKNIKLFDESCKENFETIYNSFLEEKKAIIEFRRKEIENEVIKEICDELGISCNRINNAEDCANNFAELYSEKVQCNVFKIYFDLLRAKIKLKEQEIIYNVLSKKEKAQRIKAIENFKLLIQQNEMHLKIIESPSPTPSPRGSSLNVL